MGELEATQFSTTTKLKGKTTFVIGGTSAGGDSTDASFNKKGKGGLMPTTANSGCDLQL